MSNQVFGLRTDCYPDNAHIATPELSYQAQPPSSKVSLQWLHQQLTSCYSQSKLSQDELSQLIKATHFDKKELQQWYKGTNGTIVGKSCGC